MQTPEGIKVVPASYPDVLVLLKSDSLAAIEEPIAARCRMRIIYEHGAAYVSCTQADISVCCMTIEQIETYLAEHKHALIECGIQFMASDEEDEQEYPEGEEQEPDEHIETLGCGNGFGIRIAIYHNFIANRTPAELRAYLKNRRIPKHTKFAKELAQIFTNT